MSGVTGTLDVLGPRGVKTFTWNGNVKDRETAQAAFTELMKSGSYLAVVHDSPGKSHQVRDFDEVLNIEKERGSVSAQISPGLAGG